MKRVLITGARGFIGRHCLPLLIDHEWEIHAVSSAAHTGPTSECGLKELPPRRGSLVWYQVDLMDSGSIDRLVRAVRPTHLFHLAWITTPDVYWTSPMNDAWVAASRNLLDSFVRAGGEHIVATGTCAEYDWSLGRCAEDDTPIRPASIYGRCKNELHEFLVSLARRHAVRATWARLFWLYGPGEHPSRLVSSVVRHLLLGQPIACTYGTQQRDFLHVHDAARALIALLEHSIEGTVNIGSGKAVSVADLVATIARLTGRSDLIRLGAKLTPANEPPLVVAATQRLASLGFRPEIDLESGLEKAVQWWTHSLKEKCHVA